MFAVFKLVYEFLYNNIGMCRVVRTIFMLDFSLGICILKFRSKLSQWLLAKNPTNVIYYGKTHLGFKHDLKVIISYQL